MPGFLEIADEDSRRPINGWGWRPKGSDREQPTTSYLLSADRPFRGTHKGCRIFGVLADYHADNRNLAMLGFEEWLDRATRLKITVIMTAHVWRLDPNVPHLQLDLKTNREDTRSMLKTLIPANVSLVDRLVQIMAVQQPGYVLQCYRSMSLPGTTNDPLEDVVSRYRTEMARLTGNTLEISEQVPEPLPKIDLVGLEPQLEQIERYVVRPIEWNHPDVPVKRGIVLYGPPGTGKSSIGRWLAHRLNGKLHLVGGEAGISGSTFIETIDATMKAAAKSSPAIVFIDDADVIFDQPDSYRALLTILDGLDNKRRSGICVIVTCMDLARVPSSLLRGGRLEMALKVDLPNEATINAILATGFDRIRKVVGELSPNKVLTWPAKPLGYMLKGWNCSDLRRLVDDLLREVLSSEPLGQSTGSIETLNVEEIFIRLHRSITEQYQRCNQDLNRALALGSEHPSYII